MSSAPNARSASTFSKNLTDFCRLSEFSKCVYLKVVEEEKADLRACDAVARKYGGDVAKIVAEGSPKVEIGSPRLVIEPRKSAMKQASHG